MLGPFVPHHIPREQSPALYCIECTVRYDPRGLYLSLRCTTIRWCPPASPWGVEIVEKNIHRFQDGSDALRRHFLQSHVPARCAERIRTLTDRIEKMHAYPAAYGGFSDIWDCRLNHEQKPPERVAVKVIRPIIANEKQRQVKEKAAAQELSVWVRLKHRNILPLYGITYGFGPFPAFVCPWADNGTLSEYLEKFELWLDLKKRLTLLGDIAAGLQYLHTRNIVHGDLSGSNVLITGNGRAHLSDFGLSTLMEQVSDTMDPSFSFPGNIRWAAPELVEGCQEGTPPQLSSPQADVYSFGSIMLQTLTGKVPFHGIQRVAQIVVMIARGHQPSREPGWDGRDIPDVLWEFIRACWSTSPAKRPSSEKIVHFIGCQLSRL